MNHTPTTETLPWPARALCRETDPQVFFGPDRETRPDRREREAEAKAICARCPVLDQCRDWALTTAEPFGVIGGLTEGERYRMLNPGGRRRPTAPRPPADRYDEAEIADAISALVQGDPDAVRMRLNKVERWAAAERLCQTRTPAEVGELMHVDRNTVWAWRTRLRRHLEAQTRTEQAA